MFKSYLKIALRNLIRNKVYSFINIAGLATGMAVALLIGLWIWDELSFNKSFKNYDRIGQVWQNVTFDSDVATYSILPVPLVVELRNKFPDFKKISLSAIKIQLLAVGEKKLTQEGNYVEQDFIEMMSLKMLSGSQNNLKDINSILLSESLSKTFFGSENPLNQIIKIDNKSSVKVVGVFKDFPRNSSFKQTSYLAPWALLEATEDWVKESKNSWGSNNFQIYAELKDKTDFTQASAKIKDVSINATKGDNPLVYKPQLFIHPMSKWHLYSEFKNGKNVGGLIEFVRLFGIIGIFVLLLACINFMNLSTARSEKRAKEVGIRKAVGSIRWQLIAQFFSESLFFVAIAFVLSLILSQLFLPFFNDLADKKMEILWHSPLFLLISISFILLTGIISGSYPALYLSSFQPVKVLKGTIRVGRYAKIPRKILVVIQFTVSVTLVISTIIVFRQIQFAKNRPMGYSQNKLIEVRMNTPQLFEHYQAIHNELITSLAVYEFSASSNSMLGQNGGTVEISWLGKNPDAHPLIMTNSITYEFGRTIGWQLLLGRDFSKDFTTDSSAIILNESAVKIMGFKNPINQIVNVHGKEYHVIGITKNILRESPFEPVNPTVFTLNSRDVNTIHIRLAPQLSTGEALTKVGNVFKKYNSDLPFDYVFVDADFAKKFNQEERIGKLATVFAVLAIFISCLGLFGLASFVAEQRTKEIGIRKVLGATVINLWQLLSKDFVVLVLISFFISSPVAWYFMNNWIQKYTYRTQISWWIFVLAGAGALLITLLTVSFQAIRAALANPVKSLRTE